MYVVFINKTGFLNTAIIISVLTVGQGVCITKKSTAHGFVIAVQFMCSLVEYDVIQLLQMFLHNSLLSLIVIPRYKLASLQ